MIKNLTPHPIVVRIKGKEAIFLPAGIVPRVATIETPVSEIDGIPCVTQKMGMVQGLPDSEAGVFYLVSQMVFSAAPDRVDLLAPDTGKTCIRDEQGRILAVTQLIRREEKEKNR